MFDRFLIQGGLVWFIPWGVAGEVPSVALHTPAITPNNTSYPAYKMNKYDVIFPWTCLEWCDKVKAELIEKKICHKLRKAISII